MSDALAVFESAAASLLTEGQGAGCLPGDAAGVSDAGRCRAHNEDAWLIDPGRGLLLLADGMGGYNAGEIASAIAIETLRRSPDPTEATDREALSCARLADRVEAANRAILAAAARRPECLGMGTTLVVAWLSGTHLRYAHVGDSRLYLMRDSVLTLLTRDHSVGQAMIDAGLADAQAVRQSRMRGVLTRALGVEPGVQVDCAELLLRSGDRLLLCSDGLTDMVADRAIGEILGAAGAPADLAQRLLDRALRLGGHDNVTAIVLEVARPVTPV